MGLLPASEGSIEELASASSSGSTNPASLIPICSLVVTLSMKADNRGRARWREHKVLSLRWTVVLERRRFHARRAFVDGAYRIAHKAGSHLAQQCLWAPSRESIETRWWSLEEARKRWRPLVNGRLDAERTIWICNSTPVRMARGLDEDACDALLEVDLIWPANHIRGIHENGLFVGYGNEGVAREHTWVETMREGSE
ncbi:hypothetical protein JB92DRAFT_2835040 [Gautieria morchelliformis]|nr:hypothetical protein JB92DRAFT_2835040 [Gautieria morchelliformis]